jgi:hypothetical protein
VAKIPDVYLKLTSVLEDMLKAKGLGAVFGFQEVGKEYQRRWPEDKKYLGPDHKNSLAGHIDGMVRHYVNARKKGKVDGPQVEKHEDEGKYYFSN